MIDVVKFFSENIYEDLRADPHTIHPLLQVDAIRYLYTFRSQVCSLISTNRIGILTRYHQQLSKEQLISVFPLLAQHLTSPNYVCYTYAAISIERILARKAGAQLMYVPLVPCSYHCCIDLFEIGFHSLTCRRPPHNSSIAY